MSEDKKYTNLLSKEKSPYLLQHAHNPVNWYPWGEVAFQKAKQENKPIFLSIGYSTCHWCHVMEHESFENETIAKILNDHFVAIKVDREERPDIDSVYMTSVMAIAGQGGWPLSVFLTPEKRPFFGGTYFPPAPKWGAPGFADVLTSIHDSWANNQSQVITSSVTLTEIIKQRKEEANGEGVLTENALHAGYDQFTQMFDQTFAGFGEQPKFPSSHNLSFLLRYHWKFKEPFALHIVESTLTKMAQGGLQDQLGGGFHRYSTDREWQIPHFEKMLYDQALLSRTYVEAYQVTKNVYYADVARSILNYVMRDMQDQQGGFFSAEDADSYDPDEYEPGKESSLHKKEGAFFLWREDEIKKHLSEKDAEIFSLYFGMEPSGNAKYDPHGEFTGKNVLWMTKPLEEVARLAQVSADDVTKSIQNSKAKLFKIREQRPRPHLDDKVLTDWNGLMISSFAYAGRVLNDQTFLNAAVKAAEFIQNNLTTSDGKLLHRYRDGEAAIDGTVDDYAFCVYGLLELYEATFNSTYLKRANDLTLKMVDLFWDDKKGGFFQTGHEMEELIFRLKEVYDGAMPSGNSIAATNLIRLYHMTANRELGDLADDIFKVFAQDVMSNPGSYGQMLTAFLLAFSGMKEVVIAEGKNKDVVEYVRTLSAHTFLPHMVLLKKPLSTQEDKELLTVTPLLNDRTLIDEKTTVYVCEHHQCQKPVTEIKDIEQFFKV